MTIVHRPRHPTNFNPLDEVRKKMGHYICGICSCEPCECEKRPAPPRKRRPRRTGDKTALDLVHEERVRQVSKEGWTAAHDDAHEPGVMLRAGVIYYLYTRDPEMFPTQGGVPLGWPWADEWWKPKDPIRNLARAGALCLAEQDRAQRLNPRAHVGHIVQKLRLILAELDRRLNG